MRRLTTAFLYLFATVLAISCNGDKAKGDQPAEETLTSGRATILVDNTVQPIIEDVLAVFHSVYDRSQIEQVNKAEAEIIQALLNNSADIAVLSRELTDDENAHFRNKKITPRITPFATDAIALVSNQRAADSVIDLEEVLKVLRGQPSAKVGKLVFDNANSSTVQYLLRMAGVKKVPDANVFALKTNEEVIKYVHENAGAIGIIGVNWLVQPPHSLVQYVENIKILGVNKPGARDGSKYFKPTQSNIATGDYPLIRKLYLLNYQGRQGLGMGFATYISAREGQRIILKSGLLPVNIPYREISVRQKL